MTPSVRLSFTTPSRSCLPANFVLSKVSVDEKQLADMEALNREYDKVLSATEDDTGYGVQ
ncbi:DNA packaging protein A [Enterobacter phage 02_vB_Eclo_IJM]|nr:DNA packaging protein A [Enterobacter phage 02_vB_Eclo_IJM]